MPGKAVLKGNTTSCMKFKWWIIKNWTEVFYINCLRELECEIGQGVLGGYVKPLCRLSAINHVAMDFALEEH